MGKTLLILGGSSDMALEYIKEYQERYDTILAQYFSHGEELDELRKSIGDKIIKYQSDLSDPDSVQGLISFMQESNIQPDYILHCPAGKTSVARIEEFDADAVSCEMQIEVYSILEIMKNFACHMQEQSFGRICFVISSVTESPNSCQMPYMITKYALLGTMKALAIELAGKHIMVNAVSPSMTETKFIDNVSDFVKKKKFSASPLKRLATPKDIVGAIALFLSDENEYITGQNLLIAGGSII